MWKFISGLPELKARIRLAGVRGEWSVRQRPEGNQHIFTADSGQRIIWSMEKGLRFSRDAGEPSPLERSLWDADRQMEKRRERTLGRRSVKSPGYR